MSNPGMKLTSGGVELLAKCVTGKILNFTKVAYGDGDFDYSTESVLDMTALRSWKMDLPIVGKVIENGAALIKAQLINANLAAGFRAKEIGVFAEDPDTRQEILYAYRNTGDEYSFIPSGGGIVKINTVKAYWVEISDAENVTFNIDWSFAYVSQADFNNHVESLDAHPSLFNKLNIVERIAHNADTLAKARFELAGDFNLLIAENFDETTTTDLIKIKVLSCSQGGNLVKVDQIGKIITGATYTISDGISQEIITVDAVIKNAAGFYIQTTSPLENIFDTDLCYIVKTTALICEGHAHCAAEKKYFDWKGFESFSGYPAGTSRTYTLKTSTQNSDGFIISDDGFLTVDGFLTLK